ncbi:MAG: YdcF family protein [Synechococcales cyanobacterium]
MESGSLATRLGDLGLAETLCGRMTTPYLDWKAWVTHWLLSPQIVVLGLILAIGIPWLWRTGRWRRWVSGLAALVLVLYGVAPLPMVVTAATWGLERLTPADNGQPADVIVVLGRGADPFRLREARRLWRSQRAPLIFTSGWRDGPWMAEQLEQRGIPATALQYEGCSLTTEENAQFTAAYLQAQGLNRVILVTDTPHLLRSWLIFRSLGFQVIPHASDRIGRDDRYSQWQALIVYREYVGLLAYGLRGRFWPRQPQVSLVSFAEPPGSPG